MILLNACRGIIKSNMKFLSDLFKYENGAQIIGLTDELSSFYILNKYNNKDNILILASTLYQANLFHTDMIECFHIYQSYLSFSYDEKVLFFCLISIPIKVTFTDNIYQNIIVIQNRVNYIEKTLQFLLEEDKENQKTDEEEFK